jgi:hypothetical protein
VQVSAPAPPASEERLAAQLAAQNNHVSTSTPRTCARRRQLGHMCSLFCDCCGPDAQLLQLLQMQMQQQQSQQASTPPRRKPRAPQPQLLPGSGGYGMPSYPMYPQSSYPVPAAPHAQQMPPPTPTYSSVQVTVTDDDQEDAEEQPAPFSYHAGAAAAAAAATAAGAIGSGGHVIRRGGGRGRTAPSAIPPNIQSAAFTAPQQQLPPPPFEPNAHWFQQIGQAAYQAAAASIRQLPQPHK